MITEKYTVLSNPSNIIEDCIINSKLNIYKLINLRFLYRIYNYFYLDINKSYNNKLDFNINNKNY